MGVGDLVKITTYLVRPEDVAPAGAARAKNFGDAGSATIIVKALVMPEWLIEIEAVAAAKACCSRRVGKDVAPGDAARAAQAVPGMRSASKCSPRSGIDLHHLIASTQ